MRGVSSKVEYAVESISLIHSLNFTYLKIQIDNAYQLFQRGEGIEIYSQASNDKIVETFIDNIDIEITNPGKGYVVGDKILISNTNIVGNAVVKTLKEGSINNLTIINGGSRLCCW
jgi:hypothetical protein